MSLGVSLLDPSFPHKTPERRSGEALKVQKRQPDGVHTGRVPPVLAEDAGIEQDGAPTRGVREAYREGYTHLGVPGGIYHPG